MNTSLAARIANADQLHAEVRDARDCDAINPCARCQMKTREVRRVAYAVRAESLRPPTPQRTTSSPRDALAARIAAARASA